MKRHDAFQSQKERARIIFETSRDRICAELETLERDAPEDILLRKPRTFRFQEHARAAGSVGLGGFLENGRLFEKASVHTSTTRGQFPPEMACSMPGAQDDPSYTSTSISLIIHPRSPRVPTVQMNARYFATTQYWFGGGADLTPMLKAQRSEAAPDAQLFHAHLRRACDAFDTAWYSSYKAWCDRYFFLPHRNQTRGVGGIFFDLFHSLTLLARPS